MDPYDVLGLGVKTEAFFFGETKRKVRSGQSSVFSFEQTVCRTALEPSRAVRTLPCVEWLQYGGLLTVTLRLLSVPSHPPTVDHLVTVGPTAHSERKLSVRKTGEVSPDAPYCTHPTPGSVLGTRLNSSILMTNLQDEC